MMKIEMQIILTFKIAGFLFYLQREYEKE